MSTDTSPPPLGQERRGYPPLSALRRSRTDRKLVGVAGGLGRWAGVDPLVFRILFVVLTVFGGSGILLYALGWLLIPDEGEQESEGQLLFNGRSRTRFRTVVVLIVVLVLGLAVTGSLIDSGPGLGGLGVLLVVGLGVVLVFRNGQPTPGPTQGPAAEPPTHQPVEPGVYGQTPGTAYAAAPASAYAPTAPVPPPPPGETYPVYGPPVPAVPKERSILGRVTVSVAAIVVGLLIGWNAATDSDVPAVVVVAAALGVVGIGLVVGAFIGRARGLIVLGLVLTLLASAAAFTGVQVRGGVGDRTWRPATVAELRPVYRLGAGEATLDLSRIDFSSAGRERVEVRQGVGDLLIVVPSDVIVLVDADVRAGEIKRDAGEGDGAQRVQDGTEVSERFTLPPSSAPSAAVLVIDAELGVGSMEVRRATS
jgi:phage shock protein PspC (stress-responsive transcriptional regulator)